MTDIWADARYEVAANKPMVIDGFAYRGLGMHLVRQGQMFLSVPMWCLTHLGSGHGLCLIAGHTREAFGIATEIAECGDWDFTGLQGWENRDPQLADKFRIVVTRHQDRIRGFAHESDHDMARKIGYRRM